MTKVVLGTLILGGVVASGYGVYCFCYSSYGTACYAAVGSSYSSMVSCFSTSSTTDKVSAVAQKKLPFSPDDVIIFTNKKLSVVQFIDSKTLEVVHELPFEAFQVMVAKVPKFSLLDKIHVADFTGSFPALLNKFNVNPIMSRTVVDKDPIISIVNRADGKV